MNHINVLNVIQIYHIGIREDKESIVQTFVERIITREKKNRV
jgi:hypothetical protein